MRGKIGGIKGGKKKNPQSIKEEPQQSLSACRYLLSAGLLTSEGFAWELPIFRQDQGSPCHLQAGCSQPCFYTCILKDLFLYLLMWVWVCVSMGRGTLPEDARDTGSSKAEIPGSSGLWIWVLRTELNHLCGALN